jgi:uncharacterized protein (TIGR02452 family)
MANLVDVWHDTLTYFKLKNRKVPLSEKIDILKLPDPSEVPNTATIDVRNMDSFEMAIDFINHKLNPLVLNMACDQGPGGGVAKGSRAQEEDLFRRSNAHETHPRGWYPLKANEMIYSPEITICKDPDYNRIKEVKVSMLAVAALRKPRLISNMYTMEQYQIMSNKIDAMFKIAREKKHDSLVLGAFGCGAYDNPPLIVAEMFRLAIKKYGGYFKRIGFAVLVAKPKDKNNLTAFSALML